MLLTKLLHSLVLKSAFFSVVFCLRKSGRGHHFRNRGRGGPTQRSVRDRKAKSVPSRAFLGVDILLTVCKQSLNLEYELRSSLDACSVIQIRKPQKVDSVHLDVTLSVGKNILSLIQVASFFVIQVLLPDEHNLGYLCGIHYNQLYKEKSSLPFV